MSISRLSLLILSAIFATSIQAETINCTPITSVPAIITTQGLYCLTSNLSTSQSSGNAIEIDANNVTLDLNGWKVGGQAAGLGTSANGIYSTANNVTIKNGIVRGFLFGIWLKGSGAVVQDMLVDSNTYVGIYTEGPGDLVEHNQVVNTGDSTLGGGNSKAYGIAVSSYAAMVDNNTVSGLIATNGSNEYGIYVVASNSTLRNNIVSNTALPTSGTSYGVYQDGSIVLTNTVSNFVYGIESVGGIYSYNTANDCTTDFDGGTQGAGNSGT